MPQGLKPHPAPLLELQQLTPGSWTSF
ncbi:hypothetical protein EYF80_060783 [Liparis tanakae]|uniref:Uncharacterized protein n=1 Tax=Liparis tanakae TaxID=230148 RepID=A0A4Z2EJU1_9TELE|nr:hypothetical protein EYF80_060783 [Liparis tanakae]